MGKCFDPDDFDLSEEKSDILYAELLTSMRLFGEFVFFFFFSREDVSFPSVFPFPLDTDFPMDLDLSGDFPAELETDFPLDPDLAGEFPAGFSFVPDDFDLSEDKSDI